MTWRLAHETPGQPAPIPKVPLFIGGSASGRLGAVPPGWPDVRVPVRSVAYRAEPEPESVPLPRVELYEWRTYRPCHSAAPVKLLVLQGLDDGRAVPLTQEFYPGALR